MLEPEVEPLVPLIRSGGKVVELLGLAHGRPLALPMTVTQDIVDLSQ